MRFGAIIIGDEIMSGKRQDKQLAQVIATLGEPGDAKLIPVAITDLKSGVSVRSVLAGLKPFRPARVQEKAPRLSAGLFI